MAFGNGLGACGKRAPCINSNLTGNFLPGILNKANQLEVGGGVGTFASEIGPSSLFGAYQLIKNLEGKGKTREEVVREIMEKESSLTCGLRSDKDDVKTGYKNAKVFSREP